MGQTIKISLFIFFISIFSAHSQTAEKYFEMAKQIYPDHQKSLFYLAKAIQKKPNVANYYLTRVKIRALNGHIKHEKENIINDLQKVIELEPKNPFPYCWIKSTELYFNEPLFDKIDETIFDLSLNDPYALRFLIRSNLYSKNQKLLTQAVERLVKIDDSFETILVHSSYLDHIKKKDESRAVLKTLYTYSQDKLFKDFISEPIFHPKGLLLNHPITPHLSLVFSYYYALMDRFFELDLYETKYSDFNLQKMNFQRTPHFDYFDLDAFLHLGKYDKVFKYAGKADNSIDKGLKGKNKVLGDTFKRMGLYNQASQYYEKCIPNLNQKRDVLIVTSLIQALVLDGEYQKALHFANNIKIKVYEDEQIKNVLLCTFYNSIQDYTNWKKHHKLLKPLSSYTYREIIRQNLQFRILNGKDSKDYLALQDS